MRKTMTILKLSTFGVIAAIMLAGCGDKEQTPVKPTKKDELPVATQEETMSTNIDLEEAWLWINDSPELYETDGSVKWNEGLTRYIQSDIAPEDFEEAVNKTIDAYNAHGYSYVGDESDLLEMRERVVRECGQIYFKLELMDPVMKIELRDAILQSYVDKGNTLPEGEEYDALIQQIKETIQEYTTLGMQDILWRRWKKRVKYLQV